MRRIETHLWADSFTRELSDVLQVESDVSAAIARQILATLPVPPSPQPPASLRPGTVHASTPEIANSRHAYHQGKFAYGSRGDLRGSIVFFEQAIHDDPSYAEAYAGLASPRPPPFSARRPTTASPRARPSPRHGISPSALCSSIPALPKLTPSSATWP